MPGVIVGATLSVSALSVSALYLLRTSFKEKHFNEDVDIVNKVVVITDGTSEIGKYLVHEFYNRGAIVYAVCPDIPRFNNLKRYLSEYKCDLTRIKFVKCILISFSAINSFVKVFGKCEDVLDILINNADVKGKSYFESTRDHCEITWQTNYLGHFVLTELLTPFLQKSKEGGRIINVSSGLESSCKELYLGTVNSRIDYDKDEAYSRSKLAQIMHAIEYTKRIRSADPDTKITINSCETSVKEAKVFRYNMLGTSFTNITISFLKWYFSESPRDRAQCPLFLALSKKVASISGKHFVNSSEMHEINFIASDADKCSELYDHSMKYMEEIDKL
ncbi:Dehydrogenase/reductase SDR family member on chromosome X [Strongyloides ratti]|uniref:Dehydrogenase/reductase SDR family member on chromosome X n=1 Tax=Strongyloides ratti TaxID=34506 RepID=A0A090MV38_STRRB|nr:Dehydrogenase/reductase SDR family member on chromosome X [Strongyloides ratti]CEF62623.1 Dehydrogenase/reductase SDR family member on chromosome X [Strongyloides ratti]